MEQNLKECMDLVPKSSQKVRTDKPRPHQCSICLRGFVRLEHLKRHALVHTQERPFVCEHCDKKFGRRDLMVRHIRKLHPCTQPIEQNINANSSAPATKKIKQSPPEVNQTSITKNEKIIEDNEKLPSYSKVNLPNTQPDNAKTVESDKVPRKRVRHASFSATDGSTYNLSINPPLNNMPNNQSQQGDVLSVNYMPSTKTPGLYDTNGDYFGQPTNENKNITGQEKGTEVRFSTPPPIYDILAHPEKHGLMNMEFGNNFDFNKNLTDAEKIIKDKSHNTEYSNLQTTENLGNSQLDYNLISTNLESIFPKKKISIYNHNENNEPLAHDNHVSKQQGNKRTKSHLNFMNLNLNLKTLGSQPPASSADTPNQNNDLKSVSDFQKFLGDQAVKNSPFFLGPSSSHFSPNFVKNTDYFNVKDDFYPENYYPNKHNKLNGEKLDINYTLASDQNVVDETKDASIIENVKAKSQDVHHDPWLERFIESNFEDKIINPSNINDFKLHFNDIGFDKNFIEDNKTDPAYPNQALQNSNEIVNKNIPKNDTAIPRAVEMKSSESVETTCIKTMSPLQLLSNIKSGELKLADLDQDSLATLYKVRQMDLWKEMLSDIKSSESPMSVAPSANEGSGVTSTSSTISDLTNNLVHSKLNTSNSSAEMSSILDKLNNKHSELNPNPRSPYKASPSLENLKEKVPTKQDILTANQSLIKNKKLVWFTKKLRQSIMDHHELTQFPTCKELNQYINLYKDEFHPYFDFIHLPSTHPSLENHALLCSIAAIGTLYSFHLYHATQLFVIARHSIRKILEDYTENKIHEIPLWTIQAMVNISFVEMFHNNKDINSKVDIHFHTLIRIIQITELTKPLEKLMNPPIDGRNIQNSDAEKKRMFDYFIYAQSRIRTCHIVLLVSNLFSALIGMDCRLHSIDLKEGGVPCSQVELFHCNDHNEWSELLKNKYKIKIDSKFSLVELSNGGDSYAHCLRYLCNAKDTSMFGLQGQSARNNPDSLFEVEDLHSSNLSMFTLMSMLLSIHEKIFIERSKNYSTYQWELKSKPIVLNLLDTWKSLFLKNDGVFYDIGTISEINKTPKLRLILPLYYFARIRKSINISPILKHIWNKNIPGLNKLLDDLVDSCLSANKTFFEGEDYNRNLLTEATLHCLDTIHLWTETNNYKIDTKKNKSHTITTPIFFITCISSSIIILSVFLQVLELTIRYKGELSDFEENVWIQARRILQTLENRLLTTLNSDLKNLKFPDGIVPNLEQISIQELQNLKKSENKAKLKKQVIEDRLSLKCLYLGLRILLDAPIWPVCLSFGEVLNERGHYLHEKLSE